MLCCTGEGVLSFQNLCLILLQNDHAIKYVQIKSVRDHPALMHQSASSKYLMS